MRARSRLIEADFTGVWLFALSLFLFFLLYRAILWWKLVFLPMPPRGFVAGRYGIHEYLGASGWDLLAVVALSLPIFTIAALGSARESRRTETIVSTSLLLIVAVLCGAHLRMLFDRGEPLGTAAFHEMSSGALTVREVLGYITALDIALILSPVVVLGILSAWTPRLSRAAIRLVTVGISLFALATAGSAFGYHHRGFPKSLHHNPLQYMAGELIRGIMAGPSALRNKAQPFLSGSGQILMPSDPRLVKKVERSVVPVSPRADSKKWNVVWIVMESTGFRYIDEKTPKGELLMPHLRSLRDESWDMRRHYSTSNSSHRSLFSLFSGLYPSFGAAIFCITPRVVVPTIRDVLPEGYETFLYTPAQLKSYFPLAMMLNSGFTEIKGESELRPKAPRPGPAYALNELDGAEAFARRLKIAKEPFLGIYYSYAPHYFYMDYGREFRLMPDVSNHYHRYLNNLRVLDTAIETITTALKDQGLWDNTILVLVGDHGESFGQHGLATHANDSHDEQVHVPWVLRIPGMAPRIVEEVTSHVDVVPTLLSLLDSKSERFQLQGESLFNSTTERRYIFFVGNEETANSVSREGVKVQHIYRGDRCRAYDLVTDPLEKSELPCSRYPEQDQTLADFAAHQTRALPEYNRRQMRWHRAPVQDGQPTSLGNVHVPR